MSRLFGPSRSCNRHLSAADVCCADRAIGAVRIEHRITVARHFDDVPRDLAGSRKRTVTLDLSMPVWVINDFATIDGIMRTLLPRISTVEHVHDGPATARPAADQALLNIADWNMSASHAYPARPGPEADTPSRALPAARVRRACGRNRAVSGEALPCGMLGGRIERVVINARPAA